MGRNENKMRRVVFYAVTAMLAAAVGSGIAWPQQRIDLSVHYAEYQIHVDLKPRILIMLNEGEYLYMRYFANSAFEPRMKFLGEEIFQNGTKIVDTYKEND